MTLRLYSTPRGLLYLPRGLCLNEIFTDCYVKEFSHNWMDSKSKLICSQTHFCAWKWGGFNGMFKATCQISKREKNDFYESEPFFILPFISRFWFCSLKGWWEHTHPTTININGYHAIDGKSHASIYQRLSQTALCCSPQMRLDSLTLCASLFLQSVCLHLFFYEPLVH